MSCDSIHSSNNNSYFRKQFDPSRPSQGYISSSAIKNTASLSGSHRSLCWSACIANNCHLHFHGCFIRTLAPMSNDHNIHVCSQLNIFWRIFTDPQRNKCGQTARSVVEITIQTSCDPVGGGALKKVLYGEAPPQAFTPYPFIYHFYRKLYPFRIPFTEKRYLFHIPKRHGIDVEQDVFLSFS